MQDGSCANDHSCDIRIDRMKIQNERKERFFSSSVLILKKTDRIRLRRSFVRPSLRTYACILALSTFSEPLNKQKEEKNACISSVNISGGKKEKVQSPIMGSSGGKERKKITTITTKRRSNGGNRSLLMVE